MTSHMDAIRIVLLFKVYGYVVLLLYLVLFVCLFVLLYLEQKLVNTYLR